MSDDDYIELTDPNEVVREGDEIAYKCHPFSRVHPAFVGKKVGFYDPGVYEFRRPRSTVIRDAAIELLRRIYSKSTPETEMHPEIPALREALGLTIEELRGDA